MKDANEGATIVPVEPVDQSCVTLDAEGKPVRRAHFFKWKWEYSMWLNLKVCSTCGVERSPQWGGEYGGDTTTV